MFLDTPYNKNEKWDIKDPKRYRYELATMGCRTRVYENIAGEKKFIRTWQPVIHHHEYAPGWPSKHASRQKVWKSQARKRP